MYGQAATTKDYGNIRTVRRGQFSAPMSMAGHRNLCERRVSVCVIGHVVKLSPALKPDKLYQGYCVRGSGSTTIDGLTTSFTTQ